MPRLSVLMPAYNAEATLESAVRSTLRDLPQDSELLLLDDGSTDGTAEIAQSISDHRVRTWSRPNEGVAASLNDMLDQTDSEYIARMDADDIVLPGRFSRQLAALKHPMRSAAADAVFTTVVGLGHGTPRLPRPSSIENTVFGFHLLLTNPVAHSTLMARRSVIADLGGYRCIPTEDYDLWLRLAYSGAKMKRMALPGVAYRRHSGQVTASDEWRRRSWSDPNIGGAYAQLSESLTGEASARITSLSIDDSLSVTEKRERFEAFAHRFGRALRNHSPRAQRVLRRKLEERRGWFERQLSEEGSKETASTAAVERAPGAQVVPDPSARSIVTIATPRHHFREMCVADRAANAAYPKSRFVLRWFRAAQRWRATSGPLGRAMFICVGGSYKLITEGCMGIELPVSTAVGPGLRLRHGFATVINPASRIGANVMLRQGVTLGNRQRRDDCPVIEDDVEIGVGAVIIGAVTVGRGAKIGPNAVVFTDVPPGGVVYSPASERRDA